MDLFRRRPVPRHRPRQRSHAILTVSVGVVLGVLSRRARQRRSQRGAGRHHRRQCHHRPQCHYQPPNSNTAFFIRVEKVQLFTPFSNPTFFPFYLPKSHHYHNIYNNVLATSSTVFTFVTSKVCNLTEGVNKKVKTQSIEFE